MNDVVLAGVAGGLRRWFAARGDAMPEHVRALCPVSVRDDRGRLALGNQVSAMLVDLPMMETDAAARLATITATTHDLKDREQAVGTSFLLGLTNYAAPALLALGARLVHRQPFVNLVVTNVPGPPVPLYCMGAQLMAAYPIVPLAQHLSLGIAILSYCGMLHIGLYADADAHPDLVDLGRELAASFAELRHAGAKINLERGVVG